MLVLINVFAKFSQTNPLRNHTAIKRAWFDRFGFTNWLNIMLSRKPITTKRLRYVGERMKG